MSAWIIAAREVREKARLFLFCAGLAVVPFAATLLPGARGQSADTIALVGRILAAIAGLGIAVTFGTSIARDLAERRMSFYFSKPVSAAAIWIGKAAAALFVSFSCFLIVGLPTMLATPGRWTVADPQWIGGGLAAMAALFLVSHVLSTSLRSRSPLIALDFLFLLVAIGITTLIVQPLFLGIAWAEPAILGVIVSVVLLVLAIAPVWQLANGRSDIRRSHAALMRFLWPAVAIVLLIAGGAVAWVVSVSPDDVEIQHVEQGRRGSALLVSGIARNRFDYQTSFLIDRTTGDIKRLGVPVWWGWHFSDDGRVAAWLKPVGLFTMRGLELHTTKGATGIELPPVGGFVLSADGSRIAVSNGTLVTVYDVATGRILASASGLDWRPRQQLFFLTPDLLRVIETESRTGGSAPLRVFELDVRARKMRQTADRMLPAPGLGVAVSGDGSRMFVREANVIADGRTGETIAQLTAPRVVVGEMLYDGRVALITQEKDGPHLRTYERDGTARHDVPFPGVRFIRIAAETEDGKLILAAYGKTMYVVDLGTGVIEHTLPGIRGPSPRWSPDPRLPRFAAGQDLVGLDAKGKLIVWSIAHPT
ncbi:MAG TPA: hypothetical protein VFP80_02285, partial [Thermoanaerobaculia bacterium]|nr:hypothetical protein [Thermoanaerobaculia bacterium]